MTSRQTNGYEGVVDNLDRLVLLGKIPKLLQLCKEKSYTRVAINTSDPSLPNSSSWSAPGSIVAWPGTKKQCQDGPWPAIWRIVEDLELSWGCGNSHQHQITPKATVAIPPQVWHLINGEWERQK